MFNRYLNLGHFSTAKKVIKYVQLDLLDSKSVNDLVMALENQNSGVKENEYRLTLKDESDLIKTLGDALKVYLPEDLYKKYKLLSDFEKSEIRRNLREEYFAALSKNMLLNYEETSSDKFAVQFTIIVKADEKFKSKDELIKLLQKSLSSAQQKLLEENASDLNNKL